MPAMTGRFAQWTACNPPEGHINMNKSVTRSAQLGVTALGLLGMMASMAPSALAATAATTKPKYLTMVGSNTTQEVMGAVAAAYNNTATTSQATNIYAQPADPGTAAPSNTACNSGVTITYTQGDTGSPTGPDDMIAPNGSGAGRAALATSVSTPNSCVSVARSSSPPASTDPAGTQAFAFATDAVTYAYLPNGSAPTNLSETQLQDIYDCTDTTWNQVDPSLPATNIDRFFPQNGSGSGSFFSGVLGFDPRVLDAGSPENNCSTPATQIEENEANDSTTEGGSNVPIANDPNAIMIFSAGSWAAQANGVDTDNRGGFALGTINGRANPVTETGGTYKLNATYVAESNVEPNSYLVGNDSDVQGVRNLFNFINTKSDYYTLASGFVGTKSALCTNKDASIITTYGFHPLSKCVEFNY
jgi:ABC-type phosphate transport system substrate-binding protein